MHSDTIKLTSQHNWLTDCVVERLRSSAYSSSLSLSLFLPVSAATMVLPRKVSQAFVAGSAYIYIYIKVRHWFRETNFLYIMRIATTSWCTRVFSPCSSFIAPRIIEWYKASLYRDHHIRYTPHTDVYMHRRVLARLYISS